MTKDAFPDRLYLLAPWDLPIQQQLSEANEVKLRQVLKQLLQALEQTSTQEALAMVNQELVNLDTGNVSPVPISSTKTLLTPWEIEDFDNYFGVSHVQTQEPAICLVRSLLVAYQTFLTLNHYSSGLDPGQVALQKRGFKSYVYLLARIFSLSLEEI